MKELTDKMIANMIDNVESKGASDSQQANGGADVDESIRTLMQQTCSLHRALTDLLPTNERDDMFRQIAAHLTQNVTSRRPAPDHVHAHSTQPRNSKRQCASHCESNQSARRHRKQIHWRTEKPRRAIDRPIISLS